MPGQGSISKNLTIELTIRYTFVKLINDLSDFRKACDYSLTDINNIRPLWPSELFFFFVFVGQK